MGFFKSLFKIANNDRSSSYDEYCENCGELLEDCECDDKWWSSSDISQAYYINEMMFFDEMDDD